MSTNLLQPPSGGCVLKLLGLIDFNAGRVQPPSGGCVLKQSIKKMLENNQCSRLRAAVC